MRLDAAAQSVDHLRYVAEFPAAVERAAIRARGRPRARDAVRAVVGTAHPVYVHDKLGLERTLVSHSTRGAAEWSARLVVQMVGPEAYPTVRSDIVSAGVSVARLAGYLGEASARAPRRRLNGTALAAEAASARRALEHAAGFAQDAGWLRRSAPPDTAAIARAHVGRQLADAEAGLLELRAFSLDARRKPRADELRSAAVTAARTAASLMEANAYARVGFGERTYTSGSHVLNVAESLEWYTGSRATELGRLSGALDAAADLRLRPRVGEFPTPLLQRGAREAKHALDTRWLDDAIDVIRGARDISSRAEIESGPRKHGRSSAPRRGREITQVSPELETADRVWLEPEGNPPRSLDSVGVDELPDWAVELAAAPTPGLRLVARGGLRRAAIEDTIASARVLGGDPRGAAYMMRLGPVDTVDALATRLDQLSEAYADELASGPARLPTALVITDIEYGIGLDAAAPDAAERLRLLDAWAAGLDVPVLGSVHERVASYVADSGVLESARILNRTPLQITGHGEVADVLDSPALSDIADLARTTRRESPATAATGARPATDIRVGTGDERVISPHNIQLG